jgi:hypothetical protein
LWPSIIISFFIGLGLLAFWQAIGDKSPATIGAVGVISFSILWSRTASSRSTQPTETSRETPASTPHQQFQHLEPVPSTNEAHLTSISEEALYEQAMKEVESRATRPGLWAKAFADANGDEIRQKVLYVKYRVAEEKARVSVKLPQPVGTEPPPMRPSESAFMKILTLLSQKRVTATKTGRAWHLYQPNDGSFTFTMVELIGDKAFLEYVTRFVEVPPHLGLECSVEDLVVTSDSSSTTFKSGSIASKA